MARNPRWNLEGSVYHCIARFVDHTWFIEHPDERAHYLLLLGRAMDQTDWRCLSYALMSSHIHLAMVAGKLPMASWTKPTHSPFARWLNGSEFDEWVCRTPGEPSDIGVELKRSEVRRRGALEMGTPTIVDGVAQFPVLVRPFCREAHRRPLRVGAWHHALRHLGCSRNQSASGGRAPPASARQAGPRGPRRRARASEQRALGRGQHA